MQHGATRRDGNDMDDCPHCNQLLEIIFVKFRLGSTRFIMACPNCALATAPDLPAARSLRPLWRHGFKFLEGTG